MVNTKNEYIPSFEKAMEMQIELLIDKNQGLVVTTEDPLTSILPGALPTIFR